MRWREQQGCQLPHSAGGLADLAGSVLSLQVVDLQEDLQEFVNLCQISLRITEMWLGLEGDFSSFYYA